MGLLTMKLGVSLNVCLLLGIFDLSCIVHPKNEGFPCLIVSCFILFDCCVLGVCVYINPGIVDTTILSIQ